MAESIASRVGRIVSGSVSALVAAVENAAPETVMAEAISEIDRAIDEVRFELGKVLSEKHLASTRLMKESQQHEELKEKIALALQEGRDDLAEAAAGRQIDIETQIPVLEQSVADCESREVELEGYVKALQAKKRLMKDELQEVRNAAVEATQTTPSASSSAARTGSGVEQRVAHAESAFERVSESAMNVAASRPDTGTAAQLAELDELARKNRIQERLAAAKAHIEKS